ncbi:MAG: heavy metal-binding domain-containing protein, partial [Saprospiraceae bacterium]
MIHTYTITGMSCNGCRTKVEKRLNDIDGVEAKVSLIPPMATITMEKHIPTMELQAALMSIGEYTIEMRDVNSPHDATSKESYVESCCSNEPPNDKNGIAVASIGNGKYYCPMHCEGNKVYDKAGDCPVCGMDLVKEQEMAVSKTLYT